MKDGSKMDDKIDKKIFVLDDEIARISWFQKNWTNVEYAHDPVQAEKLLSENDYDLIFLDHDLGGAYERGPLGDGIDLARVMVEKEIHKDTPIVVHSLNYDGAGNMLDTLKYTHTKLCRLNFVRLIRSSHEEIHKYILEPLLGE